MKTEIWKTAVVNGEKYENYQVSNYGRVLSLNYNRTGRSKVMSPGEVGGYLQVRLSKNRKRKFFFVHRLVAEAFLPNPENKPEVNHKIEGDKGKSMNFVFFNEDGSVDEDRTTIEWVSSKENKNYGTAIERMVEKQSKPVLQLSLTGELIREWPSVAEVGRNGFNKGAVCKCCRGERKTHKGFIWRYK